MSTTCDIDFANNDHTVYYAGQLVSGTVRLTLTHVESVRGVFVRIRGAANSYWTETEEYTDSELTERTKTRTFAEEYFNEETYFIGSENGNV